MFLFCGILPWTWFRPRSRESAGVLITSGNLIKKVLFPAEVLPTVTVLANLVHFLLGLPILLAVLASEGQARVDDRCSCRCRSRCSSCSRSGLALFLSALTVHFRDIQNILAHLLHLWFFATPVLYSYADVHGPLRQVLRLNPMTHVLVTYQQVLFFDNIDHWRGLCLTLLVGLGAFAAGAFLFDRLRDTLRGGSVRRGSAARSGDHGDRPDQGLPQHAHRNQFKTLKSALLTGSVLSDLAPDETSSRRSRTSRSIYPGARPSP